MKTEKSIDNIAVRVPQLLPNMSTQDRIKAVVKFYIETEPEEWALFLKYADQLRATRATKFAEVKGVDTFDRKLGEMPEKLHNLLKTFLTHDEWLWLNPDGKVNKDLKGPRWFFKTFPAMRLTIEI